VGLASLGRACVASSFLSPEEDWVAGPLGAAHDLGVSHPCWRFGWQFTRGVIWIRAGQARRWRVGPHTGMTRGTRLPGVDGEVAAPAPQPQRPGAHGVFGRDGAFHHY
jgi:hypothetical protein